MRRANNQIMFQFPSLADIPDAHCRPPPKGLYDIESLKTTYNVMDISREREKNSSDRRPCHFE